jgi:DNA-binding NarL/FixJ family response regulator
MLVRAIRQVAEGGVWLNQKLIEQLIGGTQNGHNGNGKANGFEDLKTDDLTNREREVVEMVGRGMNNREIAKRLFISEATVRHHLSSIYSKLHVADRLNLAIYAYREGIIEPPATS